MTEPEQKPTQQQPKQPNPSSNFFGVGSPGTGSLGRRLAGIGALFTCALVVDPARVVPEATSLGQIDMAIALQSIVIPALAALGVWLVLPNLMVLAICVVMLAGAHSELGSSDLFSGYLYPALAAVAAGLLLKLLLKSTALGTTSHQ